MNTKDVWPFLLLSRSMYLNCVNFSWYLMGRIACGSAWNARCNGGRYALAHVVGLWYASVRRGIGVSDMWCIYAGSVV
jgi:hypothetical protein